MAHTDSIEYSVVAGWEQLPHGLAVDSSCDLYVSEVTWTFAVSRNRAPADCHTFQKFSLQGRSA